jgi:excinuclease ABC subunit C
VRLPGDSAALHLVQRVRDEAHRFAVTFHRQRRRRRTMASVLEHAPGVGPKRRKALLKAFGSLKGVMEASREDLAGVVGPRTAERLYAFLQSTDQ